MEDISTIKLILVSLVAVSFSVIAMICTNFGESFQNDDDKINFL